MWFYFVYFLDKSAMFVEEWPLIAPNPIYFVYEIYSVPFKFSNLFPFFQFAIFKLKFNILNTADPVLVASLLSPSASTAQLTGETLQPQSLPNQIT